MQEFSEWTTSSFLNGSRGCMLNIARCARSVGNLSLVRRHCSFIPRTYRSTCGRWKNARFPKNWCEPRPVLCTVTQPVNIARQERLDIELISIDAQFRSSFKRLLAIPTSLVPLGQKECFTRQKGNQIPWDPDNCLVLPWKQAH